MRAWILLAQLLAPPTAPPAASAPTEVVVAKTGTDTVVIKATPAGAPVVEVVKPAVAPEVTVKAGISNEVWIALIGALVALLTPLIASLVAILSRLRTAEVKREAEGVKTDAAATKLETVHQLVNDRMSQVTGKLEQAEARIVDLQRLVSLMTKPPTAAEIAADPAMQPLEAPHPREPRKTGPL
jgi:hypothetical protein